MKQNYIVEHLGYPTTGPIDKSNYKFLSKHSSLWAAMQAIKHYTSHLSAGSWDDHYRIMHDGREVTHYEMEEEEYNRMAKSYMRKYNYCH